MAKGPELLALRNAQCGHGTPPVIRNGNISINQGDRLVLVGRNGSGKSTLLAALEGKLDLDSGERYVQPGLTIASQAQEPLPPSQGTVLDFVLETGAETYRAEAMIHALGLEPEMQASSMSGGQIRRAALARALALDPDLLLLDEPTNHLDLPAIEWLEKELASFRGGVLVISHDRAFLNKVGNAMVWLDRGELRRLDAGFEKFEQWAEEVERTEEAELNRMDQHIKQEQRYLLRGVTARRKRNVRRLEKLATLRKTRQERHRNDSKASLQAQDAEQSGKVVIEAKGISKDFGETKISEDFSMRIMRGDRIGIIGPNGAGKTTLLKMLIGQLAPDSGVVEIGANVDLGWFDQTRAQLDLNSTPWDVIGEGTDQVTVGESTRHVVGYLRDFLFSEQQARGKISTLSGGERNRLMLAKILMKPTNLMVLDEPTNDLDMDTLDLLEEMLGDYNGTLILVSHDRDFLDRLVTSVLAVEGQGDVKEYVGGYQDYRRVRSQNAKAAQTPTPSSNVNQERAKPKGTSLRLSYKDQRDLDLLPGKIDELESQISDCEGKLANPDFFTKDPEGFQKVAAELDGARQELEQAEERWLELEILQEEIQAAKDSA